MRSIQKSKELYLISYLGPTEMAEEPMQEE